MDEPRRIIMNDSTLRDGEQAPGVAFTFEEKLAIALGLEECGLDEIEVGTPAMGTMEQREIASLVSALLTARAVAWCRMTRADVREACAARVRIVNLSIPVSQIQLRAKLGIDATQMLARMKEVVSYARDLGLEVAVGGEDASRADIQLLEDVLGLAAACGAEKFRYADTLGILDPFTVFAVFSKLTVQSSLQLEFHGHNDLGLATANTLAAIRAGASHASVCVLGLGERAGNAALEEVATGIDRLGLGYTAVSFPQLTELAALVSNASRRPIPDGKAIVGTSVFTHESGIHVDGLLKEPSTYEALSPEMFGRTRNIVLGKHSGSASIQRALAQAGCAATPQQIRILQARMRTMAQRLKRCISSHELLDLYEQTCEQYMKESFSQEACA